MTKYLVGRIIQIVPVMLIVSVIVFLMLHLAPGDPAEVILSQRSVNFREEQLIELRAKLGLDRPLAVQYFDWLGNAATGDLGTSYYLRRDIGSILFERMQGTALLALGALVIALPLGIGAGVLAAILRGTIWDRVISAVVVAGVALPVFALGLFLIVIFGVEWKLLPVAGMKSFDGGDVVDRLRHLILPAVTLGMSPAAILARLTRSSMIEVLNEDFVRTARAKGLRERLVLWRHAFRNVLIPITTVIGLEAGFLLGGAVLVEVVFSWPGMGQLIVDAILQRDFPVVQGAILVVSLAYVLINLLIDVLYSFIDPRIRYGS
jgi:peptide/nickel transport system permease protein